jgi:hypothetical protein
MHTQLLVRGKRERTGADPQAASHWVVLPNQVLIREQRVWVGRSRTDLDLWRARSPWDGLKRQWQAMGRTRRRWHKRHAAPAPASVLTAKAPTRRLLSRPRAITSAASTLAAAGVVVAAAAAAAAEVAGGAGRTTVKTAMQMTVTSPQAVVAVVVLATH